MPGSRAFCSRLRCRTMPTRRRSVRFLRKVVAALQTIWRHIMINKLISRLSATVLLASAAPLVLAASDYPTKPIEMVVGYSAGGPTDVTARVLATELSKDRSEE